MSLTTGTRFGPYEIVAPLGAGGMGEVYKARDTRLDRTVALKVLPSALAADPERRARFEREARAIAALSHPHICVVHDVGRDGDVDYLVMEYLDGETLEQRLAGSRQSGSGRRATGSGKDGVPLPVGDALKIAIDIADALDKAHRAGIVHRDLKPANIMLTKSGAKLLDFGLAKLQGPAVPISMSGMERATTAGGPGTAAGTILGTVFYMAPEQVEGKEADARADLWALGVVIYEMVTGARPFDGGSAASVIGSILRDAPPAISSRQPLTPQALDHVVGRCLEKDPEDRWQTAGDLRRELQWAATSQTPAVAVPASPARPTRLLVPLMLAAAVMFAAGAAVGWRYLTAASPPAQVVQFDLQPPPDAMLSPAPVASAAQMAVSADGRQIAFVAAKRHGASQIYIRALDNAEAHALPGTDGASFPFWSPDGRYIGFFANARLKKIAVAGGTPQVLSDAPAGRGGSWSSSGVILFAATPNGGLQQISDTGGAATATTDVRDPGRIIGYNWPHFLPDGRHFLYYQRAVEPADQGVYVGELGVNAVGSRVLSIDGMAVYGPGYLAFVRDGVLFAQAFDLKTLRTSGEPVRVADHVGYFSRTFGYSAVSASPSDILAYGPSLGTTTSLRWFRRDGSPAGALGKPDTYSSPRLSPDGRSVAVAITGPTMEQRDIWTIDVAHDNPSRLTTDPAADWFPAWAPGEAGIYFGSARFAITSMFRKIGTDEEKAVEKGPYQFASYPNDVSRDGKLLLYEMSTTNGYDLAVMALDSVQKQPFLETRFNEVQGRFAPNQHFIAYASDASGQFEVYVRPYPGGSGKQWKVSLAGGMQPEWRADGREMYFVSSDGKMMAVDVSTDGDFQAGAPHALFNVDMPEASAPYPTHYAATSDGRFLVNTVVDQPTRPALTVILNWVAPPK